MSEENITDSEPRMVLLPCSGVLGLALPHWGKSIDVSMGGIAFRYIADKVRSRGSYELEIVWGDCSSRLDHIRFKTVSDCEIDSEASLNFATRRCGMQFADLTDKQKSDLRYFIQNHTTADPEG